MDGSEENNRIASRRAQVFTSLRRRESHSLSPMHLHSVSPHKNLSPVHGIHPSSTSAYGVHHHQADSYARLLLYNQCYDAMPTSSKMVVFDNQLILRKAFHGIIYQNTRHVLISDGAKGGAIEGILSVTDFIRVMLRLYRDGEQSSNVMGKNSLSNDNEDIGKMTIASYRELIKSEGNLMNLISIDANESLLEAARILASHHIHRLPVMDPENGNPLFILTHKRILKFLWCFGKDFSLPEYHLKTPKELGVGTWVGIRVVFPETPLPDCLDILLNKGVSGLPVVEKDTYKVVDMYSRFDAVGIALEDRANNLNVTVEQALDFKNTFSNQKDHVVSVLDTDTLWKAVTVLVERNVHRLCAVNSKGAIEGVISLSDVINFMVVNPGGALRNYVTKKKHYVHTKGEVNDDELRTLLEDSALQLEATATGALSTEKTYSRRT